MSDKGSVTLEVIIWWNRQTDRRRWQGVVGVLCVEAGGITGQSPSPPVR